MNTYKHFPNKWLFWEFLDPYCDNLDLDKTLLHELGRFALQGSNEVTFSLDTDDFFTKLNQQFTLTIDPQESYFFSEDQIMLFYDEDGIEGVPALESLTLSGNANLLEGETSQFTATPTPAEADISSLEWQTENSSVFTVSASGLVTAVGEGASNLRAVVGNYIEYQPIVVTAPDLTLTGFDVNVDNTGLTVGIDTAQVTTANPLPSGASFSTLTYSSNDVGAATVDASGVVTPVSAGQVVITVTDTDSGVSEDSAQITISAPE